LRPDGWKTFEAPCQACAQIVELEIIDTKCALCPACGARHRWTRFTAEGGDYIALAEDAE
jgi:Zn finger protein HypA/HybF involved in hydrogenase expression